MNEIKLNIPQYISITRSFSRKVQVKQYEPADFFASYGEQVPIEEATPEKLKEVSDRLYSLAKNDVEKEIENYSKTTSLSQEELDSIATFAKLIISGKKEEAEKLIGEWKDKLNEKQLNFLRNLFKVF